MVPNQKQSVAEVARRLDAVDNLLRQCKKTYLAHGDAAFPGHRNLPQPRRSCVAPGSPGSGLSGTCKKAAYLANPPT